MPSNWNYCKYCNAHINGSYQMSEHIAKEHPEEYRKQLDGRVIFWCETCAVRSPRPSEHLHHNIKAVLFGEIRPLLVNEGDL